VSESAPNSGWLSGWSSGAGARASHVTSPVVVTVVACILIAVSGVRGADYPAHLLRAELLDRAGAGMWNFWWYGGHPTPNYSVLVPPMVAAIGAVAVCAIASIIATYVFARLLDSALPATTPRAARLLAGLAFAVCAIVNVVVGRTSYAVGLAVGLLALAAWRGGRLALATVLTVLTPLCSPVVAAFVAIAAAAVGIDALLDRRRRTAIEATVVLAASAVPLLVMAVLFPGSGRFPFRGDSLVFSLILMGVATCCHRDRVVRLALAMAAISSLVLFVVPNPLGGNFLRFTQFFVVPVAIAGAATVRRSWAPVMWGLLVGAAVWSAQYGVVAAVNWAGDDSVQPEFHEHLVAQIIARNADGKPAGRVEIPFTDNHWESLFVASEVPYARGWERQIDLDRNPELYDPELTRTEYHDWLHHNGVRWIALANAPLDEGGRPEAEILANWYTIDWLDRVWANENWTLFEVLDYLPLVDGPAELIAQRSDAVMLRTPEPAVVTIRYEYSPELTITGAACLIPHEHDGWMTVYLPEPGEYRITADAEALLPGTERDTCRALIDESLGADAAL